MAEELAAEAALASQVWLLPKEKRYWGWLGRHPLTHNERMAYRQTTGYTRDATQDNKLLVTSLIRCTKALHYSLQKNTADALEHM